MHQAWTGLSGGDMSSAWNACKVLINRFPDFDSGLDVSSRVALAMGQRELAADLAQRAINIDGDNFRFLSQKTFCLLAQKKMPEALALIELLAKRPLETGFEHDTLGNLYSQAGDQYQARARFERAVECDPDRAHFWLNLALSLQATGDLQAAEHAFERCIELEPLQGDAWLHRSRLHTQSTEKNHIEKLQAAIAGCSDNWRLEMSLRYALAKELEDLGRYTESFAELRGGSSLRRARMNHDAAADIDAMEIVKQVFSGEYMRETVASCDSSEPIFIVGLPRTGTTLVERILGSHSQVFAAGELNDFAQCLTKLVAPLQPKDRMSFIRLSAKVSSKQLGQDYIDSARPQMAHTPYFVDKLPLNFLYCGLISRALPRAKIIHLQRDPMDTCFAIYKTLFKQAYPFSYDLKELGDYYLSYRDLMAHWQRVMPDTILDVCYETLVADPELQTRRLLEHCNLPWESECLDFHRNSAPSMTASLAQVRKPLYTSSIGKWRRYQSELSELQNQLEGAGLQILR
ncbi:MAG: sulfotransferase [Halioglobus sp.]